MLSDTIVGYIRTYVPVIIGGLLALLARQFDIVIDEETEFQLALGFAGVVVALYYALVRIVAKWLPWAGVFLGYNVKPTYNDKSKATSYNVLGVDKAA